MKKIFFLIICVISVFLIFILAKDSRINYLSIGDSSIKGVNSYNTIGYGYNDYLKNYLQKNDLLHSFNDYYYNHSIDGLIDDIRNNKTIVVDNHEYYFKKILRESNLVVVSIGMDELAYYFDNQDLDKTLKKVDDILTKLNNFGEELIKYAKNDIIFMGYYNPTNVYNSDIDELFCYLDDKASDILKKYDIEYISLYESVKGNGYLINPNNHHLSTKGYLMMAEKIISYIENM